MLSHATLFRLTPPWEDAKIASGIAYEVGPVVRASSATKVRTSWFRFVS